MIIAAAVDADGLIAHSWGKARTVAVAEVEDDRVRDWQEYSVGWDVSHDEGPHGAHHARVVRFLRTHRVQAVLARQVGEGMRRMLGSMDVRLIEGAAGDARAVMLSVAA